MMLMGIDQSYTSTGIVVLDHHGSLIAFGAIASTKTNNFYQRAIEISNQVQEWVVKYKPEWIAMEELAYAAAGNRTRDLAGLRHVVICDLMRDLPDVKRTKLAPTSLKKHATRSGRATKDQMVDALPVDVLKQFEAAGYKKSNGLYDLTDAYHLARFGHYGTEL